MREAEQYRAAVRDTLEGIADTRRLQQIFTIVKRFAAIEHSFAVGGGTE